MRWTLTLLASLIPAAVLPAADESRTLFIAIDAVPFATMEELASDPTNTFFGALEGPVPVISTFPSSTSLALGAILSPVGADPSPGYEAKFYSWESNGITGGGLISYEPFPWRSFFDWKVHTLWRKATSAMRPIKAGKKDIRQSLRAFSESPAQSYFIYYDTTDSAGHLKSPEGLKPILTELDRRLTDLRRSESSRPFRVVIFSDHGIAGGEEPLRNTRKAAKKALRREGYRSHKKLIRDTDVVFVPFGLLSSFIAYARPGQEANVAATITTAPGVDLCAFPDGDGWSVVSSEGSSHLGFRAEASTWSYRWSGSDPLDLDTELKKSFEGDQWLSDDEVFATLRDHRYPDAFHRIATAFELVANPASIACSVEEGHMYGGRLTATFSRLSVGRLKWTHGSLRRDASLGFFMTDAEGWKAAGPLRFDQVLEPFRAHADRGADAGQRLGH